MGEEFAAAHFAASIEYPFREAPNTDWHHAAVIGDCLCWHDGHSSQDLSGLIPGHHHEKLEVAPETEPLAHYLGKFYRRRAAKETQPLWVLPESSLIELRSFSL